MPALHINSQRAPFETPPEEGGSSGRAVQFLFLHRLLTAHAEEAPFLSGAVSKRARLRKAVRAKLGPPAWLLG
jgi:hypothetical protein